MGCEPWPPLRLARLCREHVSVVVVLARRASRTAVDLEGEVRSFGLDVHRDFCEVAICEDGRVRSAGPVATSREALQLFADGLGPTDQVALEATGNALRIARLLEPHAARVVVASTKDLKAISEARVKTDRLDARTLAKLLEADLLTVCWVPDEVTRALRRRLARRSQLVRQRTRCKNEIPAVLMRNLKGRPPASDLFGRKGRRWLAEQTLPIDERETVEGCLRQIDFLDGELAQIERAIAQQALASQDIRRLLTVPGVNLASAATFIAVVGDVRRFPSPRKLVGYLGLDPIVRQSGSAPARHGSISKAGASEARHMLTEAALAAVATPGPLRAFHQRVRSRRGPQIAIIAVARKLAVLFWHLLTRGEDYAYRRPSLTQHKVRQIELLAGAPRHRGQRGRTTAYRNVALRDRERALTAQAERAYERLVADWQQTPPKGAGAAPGARIFRLSRSSSATGNSPKPCALARGRPRRQSLPQQPRPVENDLTCSVPESPASGGGVRRVR
jgi:transposase